MKNNVDREKTKKNIIVFVKKKKKKKNNNSDFFFPQENKLSMFDLFCSQYKKFIWIEKPLMDS